MDLALKNLQRLICHTTQTTNQPTSSIIGASPSDCLVSYRDIHCRVGSYPSAEKQSAYPTTPTARAMYIGLIFFSSFSRRDRHLFRGHLKLTRNSFFCLPFLLFFVVFFSFITELHLWHCFVFWTVLRRLCTFRNAHAYSSQETTGKFLG